MARQLLVQAARPEARPGAAEWELLVPYGRWEHPQYGQVDNSAERVARYHQHFQAGVKRQGEGASARLPFTLDHDDGRGAAGWILDTRLGERGLEGLVEFTGLGLRAIAEETYPFISPDLVDAYEDPQSGEIFQDVLAGASLVVRPYFKCMPQVFLESYDEDPEPLVLWEDLEKMAMPTGDERTEGTEQQAAEETTPATDGAEQTEQTAEGTAETQSFGDVTDLKSFAELREEVSTLRHRERLRSYSDELEAHSFGDGRRIAPASRDSLARVLASLPAAQAAEVTEAVKTLRFYEPGETGLSDARASQDAKQFSDEDRAFMARHGLSEEDYDAAD